MPRGPSIEKRVSPRRGHHSALLSLADQAISSGTNFLTGVIIGRTCAAEEFGLYLLGFSLLVFALDVQNSLISTPFVVLSPRLEASARARYTGSTLVHQLCLSAVTVFVLLGGAFALSKGLRPEGLASTSSSTSLKLVAHQRTAADAFGQSKPSGCTGVGGERVRGVPHPDCEFQRLPPRSRSVPKLDRCQSHAALR